MRFVEDIWQGHGAGDRLARAALRPFEGIYRGAVSIRGQLYDHGVLGAVKSPIPVISVGNLTVGGTGKTPVASWVANRLSDLNAKPAIVLRGYGGDEILVHRQLIPEVPVIADKDRSEGILRAAALGATVAVLDDAFQHRRAMRDADIVIVSADTWTGKVRLLPAGPWREPLESIGRASLAVVSRKAASVEDAEGVAHAIALVAPDLPKVIVRLRMSGLVNAANDEEKRPLSSLSGRRVLAVSAVGDPGSFTRQLMLLGADVTHVPFRDHHPFSAEDTALLVRRSSDYDIIVCTLKDAVKLRSFWPADGQSLWYVSQSLDIETGAADLDNLLGRFRPAK